MEIERDKIRALAGFRSALRRFLVFSEEATSDAGVTSLQYQALLAIAAAEGTMRPGDLAKELLLKSNAGVQMVDRLEALGLVARSPSPDDRRAVTIALTEKGKTLVAALAAAHLDQLSRRRKQFADILRQLKRTQAR
ncbi:MAG TPA: MarR family transcriptional regulator [Rhizomicrobium sp.]|nr:MarR family transcriptional regulator [Rhizomicrobium sp.]